MSDSFTTYADTVDVISELLHFEGRVHTGFPWSAVCTLARLPSRVNVVKRNNITNFDTALPSGWSISRAG